MKNILITGGTGLVGTQLAQLLLRKNYNVSFLTRKYQQHKIINYYLWDIFRKQVAKEAIQSADIIIHLAGAGIANKRWSNSRKKEIYDSRVDSTTLLFEMVKKYNPNLEHFICASAIGYYGWDCKKELLTEDSPHGTDFLAKVVADWEKATDQFETIDVKFTKIRIGLVLSDKGGALAQMMRPISMGLGTPLASGNQYMSWIHIQDICQMILYLLENNLTGVYNACAPQPVTNKEFMKVLADCLGRKIVLPNLPSFILRGIFGEMANILIGGNNVSSQKIQANGFLFQYPVLANCLEDLIKKKKNK